MSKNSTSGAARRILFVGDSLTYWNGGVDQHFAAICESAHTQVDVATATQGGAAFEVLWKLGGKNSPRHMIEHGGFDVVVLQEDLPETSVKKFKKGASLFIDLVRKSGAVPLLYMPWGYERLGWIDTAGIAAAHSEVGAKHGVDVAPCGDAWMRAAQSCPGLQLFDRDFEHPSVAGTYLASLVIYATLFGLEGPSEDLFSPVGVSPDNAARLQALAVPYSAPTSSWRFSQSTAAGE